MAIPRELRKAIEGGDLDSVEDAWLGRLEEDPNDLAFFVGVAKGLAGQGRDGRARMLLDLLEDQYQSSGDVDARLRLLEQAGHLLYPSWEELHPAILDAVRALYPDSPSRDGLIERVGLERAPHDIPKTWEKVARLRGLLQFEVGTAVQMKGKGAGRIAEVNLQLDSIKVDFLGGAELRVGFAAAPKLLQTLPEGHVLRRKLEDLDGLRALRTDEPAELLRLALESGAGPMTAAEVRETLSGVIDEADWTSWWSTVREDPRVVTRGKGRQTYQWAGSGAEAATAVREAFGRAELAQQLEIFRRNSGRDPELAAWMASRLAEAGRRVAASEPGAALTIWSTLDKAGLPPEDGSWSPERLVAEANQPTGMVAAIDDRALREAVLLLIRERRDDWTTVYRGALDREGDPRVLELLLSGLREGDPERAQRFVNQVLSQPRKRPEAFVWLAERAAEDEAVRRSNPLRLLQLLAPAVADEAFAAQRVRLRRLWEDGSVLRSLIDRLDEEQAAKAHRLFEAAPIEEYLRIPYKTAVEMRFPSLSGDRSDVLYAVAETITAKRAELKDLLEREIPENRRAIETAREMGDLRENFEYKAARQRHEFLSARAAALDADLRRARAIDLQRTDADRVRIGSIVRLEGDGGAERQVTILGPWESRPEDGVFSYDSDAGRHMLGKTWGEELQLEGDRWRIASIEPFNSAARD